VLLLGAAAAGLWLSEVQVWQAASALARPNSMLTWVPPVDGFLCFPGILAFEILAPSVSASWERATPSNPWLCNPTQLTRKLPWKRYKQQK